MRRAPRRPADAAARSGPRPRAAGATNAANAPALLTAALDRRAALVGAGSTDALRLVHDAADGLPGFVLEQFGRVLIAQFHEGRLAHSESELRELCVEAMKRTNATAVYRKTFPRERSGALRQLEAQHSDARPWLGQAAAPEFAICENGLRFLVRPYDGYSVGLFLEHRDNRQRVRDAARGRRVLNGFAYTCGFSVAAAAGGASEVVSVDVSKKSLEWGKRNFAENVQSLDAHRFICDDVLAYYARAARQGRVFDLIILDPPTFARAKQSARAFSIRDQLDALVAGAVERLAPGGKLLLCTNHRATTPRRLHDAARSAAESFGRRLSHVQYPELPIDFAGDADYAKSALVDIE